MCLHITHLNACPKFSTLSKDHSDTRKRWAYTRYNYIYIAQIQQQNQFTVWAQLRIWPLNYLLHYHQTVALQIYRLLKISYPGWNHMFYSKKNAI